MRFSSACAHMGQQTNHTRRLFLLIAHADRLPSMGNFVHYTIAGGGKSIEKQMVSEKCGIACRNESGIVCEQRALIWANQ